jgi:hypothetical protein
MLGRSSAARAKGALFRGFAMTSEEQAIAMEEIHRLAFNVTIAVQQIMRERIKRRSQRAARQRTTAAKAA